MSWWEALFLAVIEGLTEFLPVSSTGHLVLASSFLGIAKETFVQDFEIIIQGGAILAVVVHSFSRLWQPKLYVLVGAAFVPTALMGYFLHDYVEAFLDRPLVVAGALIGGGVWLTPGAVRPCSVGWRSCCAGVIRAMHGFSRSGSVASAPLDLIKIYFDFRTAFCVSIEFGSYAARNMFP